MTNCEFPAQCVDTSSGFSCICSDGYVGVPPQCEGECYNLGMNMQWKRLPENLYAITSGTMFIVFARLKLYFHVLIYFFALLGEYGNVSEILLRKA